MQEKIMDAYMDHVLTEEKEPASVYAFARKLKITESDFYRYFSDFADIERTIWTDAIESSITSLKAAPEYAGYSSREKILGFFYTLLEALNMHRSYYRYSMRSGTMPFRVPEGIRDVVISFSKEVIQEGLGTKQIEDRKFISDRYPDAVWMNFLFILKFWSDDSSKGFEKTDAAVEKSVNLMMELMGKSALDGMLDLGKFLLQNGIRSPFQMP